MLTINFFFDNIIIMYVYMFIYNISIFNLLLIISQYRLINFKTLYSLSDLSLNTFSLLTATVVIFSMAGVPPFLGFFSKVLILIALINSNFFFMFIFFFPLLFLGLYFYVQNIRFLYTTSYNYNLNNFYLNYKSNYMLILIATIIMIILILGFIIMQDLLLFFY